ncbi:zinc finger protein PLAG1-like [Pollicipes pollicipes]|uniref:zinc finger protein PLAG1-like n=1 Tax=Pollicipes pollicipes TaxID=41117 RepID=UPI0018859480|nr:zinc finger protein PLAG1-like [Pollicipes pollicipes]
MGHGMATPPIPTNPTPADSGSALPPPPAPAVPSSSAPASSEALAVPGPSRPTRRVAATRRKRANRCVTCSKSFSSPGKLAQHQYSHTGERPYVCQRCDKSFSSKFKLMRHVLTHSKERQFKCTECSKGFYRKDHLKNHMETHNPNKQMFHCPRPSCGKEYTSSTGLKKHVALHEAEDGNLMCTLCGITFQAKEDIIFHLKTHAGSRTVKSAQDKKFQCDVCKKRFFTRKDVKRHLVVHTGSRDFVCDLCPQKFGRKDHLVRHMKKSHSTGQGCVAAFQQPLPDMDIPEPVTLPNFEPPEVLPDLLHTPDLSAMLRSDMYAATEMFFLPHARQAEHPAEMFALAGPARPVPHLARSPRLPVGGKDLSSLMQTTTTAAAAAACATTEVVTAAAAAA